ncbi:hypothetical protein [Rhodoferax koreensis]|nr:hypothetical protein [Rhodoferax koreense]
MSDITYRIVHRRDTVLVFERGPDKRPTSSLQVARMGDNGMIDSLMGAGFYKLMETVGLKPFHEMGVSHVYAAMTDIHLDMLRERMPLVKATWLRPTVVDGIPMNWVEITASGEEGAHFTESNFAVL